MWVIDNAKLKIIYYFQLLPLTPVLLCLLTLVCGKPRKHYNRVAPIPISASVSILSICTIPKSYTFRLGFSCCQWDSPTDS